MYTNNVPCGYMRGPGEPQAMFAVESQMDCVARAIGMDPVELRRKNLIREGDANAIGASFQAVRAVETLDRAVAASGFYDPKPSDGRTKIGRGIAIGDRSQARRRDARGCYPPPPTAPSSSTPPCSSRERAPTPSCNSSPRTASACRWSASVSGSGTPTKLTTTRASAAPASREWRAPPSTTPSRTRGLRSWRPQPKRWA